MLDIRAPHVMNCAMQPKPSSAAILHLYLFTCTPSIGSRSMLWQCTANSCLALQRAVICMDDSMQSLQLQRHIHAPRLVLQAVHQIKLALLCGRGSASRCALACRHCRLHSTSRIQLAKLCCIWTSAERLQLACNWRCASVVCGWPRHRVQG